MSDTSATSFHTVWIWKKGDCLYRNLLWRDIIVIGVTSAYVIERYIERKKKDETSVWYSDCEENPRYEGRRLAFDPIVLPTLAA